MVRFLVTPKFSVGMRVPGRLELPPYLGELRFGERSITREKDEGRTFLTEVEGNGEFGCRQTEDEGLCGDFQRTVTEIFVFYWC